jgi:hypothetical protein
MKRRAFYTLIFTASLMLLFSCKKDNTDPPDPGTLQLVKVRAGNLQLTPGQNTGSIPVNSIFYFEFSGVLDTASARQSISISESGGTESVGLGFSFADDNKTVVVRPLSDLSYLTDYSIEISDQIKGSAKQSFPGYGFAFTTEIGVFRIESVALNGISFPPGTQLRDVSFDEVELIITFSDSLNPENYQGSFSFFPSFGFQSVLSNNNKTVKITNNTNLSYYTKHNFTISSNLTSANSLVFGGYHNSFVTGLDLTPKFPPISDEDLLTLVQQQTFKYFWDFAHPVSGLARERNSSGDLVTIGGSGFGVMSIIVGIERGFISRVEGVNRLSQIVDFLSTADRFHGVWPHWMNGNTGKTIPFSTKDNGGDLVETSFMAAGLLTVRQYLDAGINSEDLLINEINTLLNEIDWTWYTRGGQNVLYWHWSPNYGWDMNMQVRGYNEALITYFMAATSTTFPVDATVYQQGWARSGNIINGKTFYGIPLPVGYDFGGPLFFAHYSFLGLNPTNLSDQYANYWTQNRNHTLINRQHCIVNPYKHVGYSTDCWGLTASDNPWGYLAHEPVSSRDNGTITPTAALSSMPFTPEESLQAMRHFYYILGDRLWGEYGFYDAFNPGAGWWANSYLAIDQGPIVVMIENYRSGLCWDLFMSAPEVQQAMTKLGFSN